MLTEYLSRVAMLGAEWVLYLLAVLSVVSVAMMIERLWTFFRTRESLARLEAHFLAPTGGDSVEMPESGLELETLKAAEQLVGEGTESVDPAVLSERVEALMAAYRRDLERFLPFLGTMGNNAPFIGLFGTVIGVIQAFAVLGDNPEGGAGAVMSGISEALVATGAGLAVAIPAVVAYNFFSRMVDGYADRFTPLLRQRIRSGRKQ